MDAFDEEIRKGYSTHMKPASICITAEDLEAFYTERLPTIRMAEIRSHIASCNPCLELSREYCAFWEISTVAKIAQPWYWPRPALQVAAVVVLAIGLGLVWTITRTSDQPDAIRSTTLSSGPQLISPKGDLQKAPGFLEWQPVESADHYEVEIQDAQFNVVWKEPNVKAKRASIPDKIVEAMKKGSYGWRVTAVMTDGRRTVSPFSTFRVVAK